MNAFDITSTLKVQRYMNEQNLDSDIVNFLSDFKFANMYTSEQYEDIKRNVETYRALNEEQKQNPSYEVSKKLKELNEDILYATGQNGDTIQLSELQTSTKLDDAMSKTNLRSRNDLRVEIDYSDYTNNTNYVKVKVVGHDVYGAYGVSANARMIVLKNGDMIVPKNSLYTK